MIYIITDGVFTKIGKSKSPLNRIKALQTSNAKTLKFQYIFDVPDNVEKRLHTLFKKYKTNANNEWFQVDNITIETKLKSFSIAALWDTDMGLFKAKKLNNELFRGDIHTTKNQQITYKKLYKNFGDNNYVKQQRNYLIEEMKFHLKTKKNIRISYDYYIKKYKFNKNEISFYMKSCGLNKQIFDHNSKL